MRLPVDLGGLKRCVIHVILIYTAGDLRAEAVALVCLSDV